LLIQNFLRVVDRLSTLAFIFKSIMIVLPLWLAVAALAVPVERVALFGAALWTPTLFVGSFSFCLRWPAPGGVGVMLGCVCSFGSSSASLFGSWVACPGVGRQPVTNSFFVYQPRVVSGLSQFWPVRCTWLVVVAVFLWLVLTASVMEGIASNFIIENAGTCRDRLGTSISSRNAHYSPSLVSFFSCSGPFGPLTLFCCFFGSFLFSTLIFCFAPFVFCSSLSGTTLIL
jgi:hypothetical protein